MYSIRYQGLTDKEFARLVAYNLAIDKGITKEEAVCLIDLLTRFAATQPDADDAKDTKDPAQMELAFN